MRAKYFRLMYQNKVNSVVHTISVADTEKETKWNALYLCELVNSVYEKKENENRCLESTEVVNLLVLANLRDEMVHQALEVAHLNEVKKIVIPDSGNDTEEIKKKFISAGVGEVIVLSDSEEYEDSGAGWGAKLICLGKETEASVVMYHDAMENSPKEDDCVLLVKPSSKKLPCTFNIDGENLNCDMRCSLYNDFDVCKGHKKKDSTDYITGSLLLGNVNLNRYGEDIQKLFSEEKGRIRFLTLPNGGGKDYWNFGILHWLDTKNESIKRYFIAPAGAVGNEITLKEIMNKGPRFVPILTGAEYGICASGFFTKRL